MIGLIWELCFQPAIEGLSKRWVRFVLRKQSIWTPGNPAPATTRRVWESYQYASIKTLGFPWPMFRLRRDRLRWDEVETRGWR